MRSEDVRRSKESAAYWPAGVDTMLALIAAANRLVRGESPRNVLASILSPCSYFVPCEVHVSSKSMYEYSSSNIHDEWT